MKITEIPFTEWKRINYQSNKCPKIGHTVRLNDEIAEGNDLLYTVTSIMGGRVGNKVGVILTQEDGVPIDPDVIHYNREYYYNCLCPQ
jgi:hypothetical protein